MNARKNLAPDLDDLLAPLSASGGRNYWRSLEELADNSSFQELMSREFPGQMDGWTNPLNRRRFLTLMGASLALAGVAGCSVRPAPRATAAPYVRTPAEVVPGKPLFFATAMTLGGAGVGLLVESHLGRPTKIEGNPEHPTSLGATSPYHQASVLSLYDPDRSQSVTRLGQPRTWDEALAALHAAVGPPGAQGGSDVRLLTETVVSPTLAEQIRAFLKAYPQARWHQFEPLACDSAHQANLALYGEPIAIQYLFYDLDKKQRTADIIVSLDSDFLASGPASLRYTAEFTAGRRMHAAKANADMSRLYVIEPAVTCTGARADHRLALRAGDVEAFTRALAVELGVKGAPPAPALPEHVHSWLKAVADDLRYTASDKSETHRQPRPPGTTLVIPGDRQPEVVHRLAQAINHHLGNVGHTVLHTDPITDKPVDHGKSLRELTKAMAAGQVKTLLMLGGNPVYNAPVDLAFTDALRKVSQRFHLSLYQDETSRQCQWHLPETHYLEAWGDVRACDGTVSIVQPLIEPLYHGRSPLEILAALTGERKPAVEIVRDYWRRHGKGKAFADFEAFWQTGLHDGVIAGTALPVRSRSLKGDWHAHLSTPSEDNNALELVFQEDPALYDGRFANNGWLQECPRPITRLTWDNAAIMSPATARQLGFSMGDYAHGGEHGGYHQPVIELRLGDRTVRAPVWVTPGQADQSVTVHLGYGREAAGKVGNNIGFNAGLLRTSSRPWFASGLVVQKTSENQLVACVQQHHLMENRDVVRSATLEEFRRQPDFAADKEREEVRQDSQQARKPLTMYQREPPAPHQWGMSIDLNACIGCQSCVIACQAENNIPIVGKDQVSRGREMHWIRIDRYIRGTVDNPTEFHFQPIPCMHCENAPCEYVCPVEATVHSADGLNDMVYQRCVGTRFCSNNCPYKVRRFNFLAFADSQDANARKQLNPEVTVRSRGVMEKCNYCLQRIRHAEIGAQSESRPIRDGEILTACQAACPAQAIVFGNIKDPESEVKRRKDSSLNYGLLTDLNTVPRTTYLAALRNPNPRLEE